jgi:hypothetical protein
MTWLRNNLETSHRIPAQDDDPARDNQTVRTTREPGFDRRPVGVDIAPTVERRTDDSATAVQNPCG